MAIGAGYIIPPVLAAFEVIMFFLAGMTLQTRLGDLLGCFIFESSNLCLIATTFDVSFAWAVARFTPLLLWLPTGSSQRCVNRF